MLQDNVDGLLKMREYWNPTHVQVRGARFYNFKYIHIICTWTHGPANSCLASRQSPCYVSEVVPELNIGLNLQVEPVDSSPTQA